MQEEEDDTRPGNPCIPEIKDEESEQQPDFQTLENLDSDPPFGHLNDLQQKEEHDQHENEQLQEEREGTPLSPTLPNTSHNNPRKPAKRNKKLGRMKLAAMEKKLQVLTENLKPIPFVPNKALDFDNHEVLLKRLGLWDFVHIEFDQNIRIDLIGQLIVSYTPSSRSSYVNGTRVMVNRADLGRALKLPVKKEKLDAVDSELMVLADESTSFIEEFVSNWVLLHDDTWMMPNEIWNLTRVIKEGRPEKVDWAGLIWFMVEKEILQGKQLENCYYASHLQYLIKCHREELLWEEEAKAAVDKEDDVVDLMKVDGPDDFPEQSIELTLGQEITEKERETMNVQEQESKEEEDGQWLLERCSLGEVKGFDDGKQEGGEAEVHEGEEEVEVEVEEEEEEDEEKFNCLPTNTLGALSSASLAQEIEAAQIPFSSNMGLRHQSALELHSSNAGKRDISPSIDLSHHSLNANNNQKRLRIDDNQWDHKPSDFDLCMENLQSWMGKARMVYEAKEQAFAESNMNQQILIAELQQRDSMIEHLQKTKFEEVHRRQMEIYRLERELYVMGNLLAGYRKALKETHRAFSEYRERSHHDDEPIYKDVGIGGDIMSITEIEKQRLKREEEDRSNRLFIEEKMREFEEGWLGKFEVHQNKVCLMGNRLQNFEEDVKGLKESIAKPKNPEMSKCSPK